MLLRQACGACAAPMVRTYVHRLPRAVPRCWLGACLSSSVAPAHTAAPLPHSLCVFQPYAPHGASHTLHFLLQAHRLDLPTGGLMLVAKTRPVLQALCAMLAERAVDKRWVGALVDVSRQQQQSVRMLRAPDACVYVYVSHLHFERAPRLGAPATGTSTGITAPLHQHRHDGRTMHA